VTRIIGGRARGRRLVVPPRGTRPTSERAREGLFNSVRSELDLNGARVLDLFAGSGAVGLEALSHGASLVVLVESDRQAGSVIESNITAVGLPGARLVRQSAETYLAGGGPPDPFDLIFADPPYALAIAELAPLLDAASRADFLAEDGLVVVERNSRDAELEWPVGVTEVKRRRYGEAQLWYGRRERGPG
jgi:16S rRNA (guanine966-N2)-methyltransferase